MQSSSRRPSLALIVALLALVVALGGTAGALPGKGSVQSNDIKKNAVKGKHVKNDSIKGADVLESSLDTVRSAENGATRISYKGVAGGAPQVIFNGGGLVLKATCVDANDLVITMESTVNDAAVFADSHDHDGSGAGNDDADNSYEHQGDFDAGQPVVLDGSNLHSDDGQGVEINYSNPNGTEVLVKFQNWLGSGVATAPAACFVGGVGFVV